MTSWLYRTTMNACFDQLRVRKPTEPIEWEPPVPAPQQAELEQAERRRLMAEGLTILAERERAAVILREIEGLDTAEVAGILGITEVTVRSQISIAKGKLKAFVERRMR
ncbi:MAG: RNA polymerase sigma factor [Paludibaculum sp.]